MLLALSSMAPARAGLLEESEEAAQPSTALARASASTSDAAKRPARASPSVAAVAAKPPPPPPPPSTSAAAKKPPQSPSTESKEPTLDYGEPSTAVAAKPPPPPPPPSTSAAAKRPPQSPSTESKESTYDYWKPSSPKRTRRPDSQEGQRSWATQLRMKKELQAILAVDESEEVREKFDEVLGNFDKKLLQPKGRRESARQFQNRTEKARSEYNQALKDQYGPVDHNVSEFLTKHNIQAPNPQKCDTTEIWKIRYEPPNTDKTEPTFRLMLGSRTKSRIFVSNVTVAYVKHYLGKGFVEKCIAYGERCSSRGINQPSFFVPLGDSNLDVAPNHCLLKLQKNGDQMKMLPYVKGNNNCCLGFSLANALHYLNFHKESWKLYQQSHDLSELDATAQFKWLLAWVQVSVEGVAPLSLKESKEHFDGMVGVTKCLKSLAQQELVVFVPKVKDGTNTHAVACTHGLIFDSTQKYPMKLCRDSLSFIAGSAGFGGIWRSRLFTFSKALKGQGKRYHVLLSICCSKECLSDSYNYGQCL
ncbi:unnamed protein product [Cylindrotheca closterium]|uniref:Uncharacterized protein n=1 Tax=Cylindrotheca closterium TaxID=2856 RepID=A0AAD2FN86_9STRA|nr:unnamed protein product [Cylindrotheca closterium]